MLSAYGSTNHPVILIIVLQSAVRDYVSKYELDRIHLVDNVLEQPQCA